MFTADVEGENALRSDWAAACNILRQRTARAVGLATKAGVDEMKAKHTFRNRSFDLEKSMEALVEGWRGETFWGVMRAGAKHASFVEYDTPKHQITGNPFLTFIWKGERVSFRYVMHPGTTGQPFMHLAYYKAERVLEAEIEKGVVAMQSYLSR